MNIIRWTDKFGLAFIKALFDWMEMELQLDLYLHCPVSNR